MGPAALQLLSLACLAFTLGMFGTGLSDLRQMFATQSVENIQFLPFLTTDVNMEKRAVLLKTMGLLAVLFLGYCYFNLLVPDVSTRLARLGLFCSLFTITMYLSPLADLAKIIKTRSTQCISFPLTITTFLASASWTLYGLLLQDLYIAIPNVPGIITSILRFWLFWHFPPDHNRTYKLLHT